MQLIVDSGSTKTEWILLIGKENQARFLTAGFNPNYADIQDFEDMVNLVETRFIASLDDGLFVSRRDKSASLRAIHYFGTGCGSEQNCQLIKEVLQRHFPQAEIEVTHDMMAAAKAVLGHEKGIACILGTGSNSCLYDGENIIEKAVSLGYLIGDEGSGCHIGKEIVRAYFYGFMPEALRQKFEETYHLELKDFIEKTYHQPQPSKYLATFAKFAGENQNEPFVHDLVKHCFNSFVEAFVFRYRDYKTMKVSFVGSVAYHFQDILKECMQDYGLTMGKVMAAPAEGLVRYYLDE